MQHIIRTTLLLLVFGSFIALQSCKEDEEPAKYKADFSGTSATVAENAGAASSVTINFEQKLAQSGTITVSFTTSGAYTTDFTTNPDGASGSFELSANAGDQFKTFTITPVDDTDLGSDVTVTFTLASATGGIILGTGTTYTVTIEDNESPSTVSFADDTYTVPEDGAAVTVTLNLGAAAAADGSFKVDWTSSDATYTTDFTTAPDGSSGSIAIAVTKGETSKTFDITPVDNSVAAEDKNISFSLSGFTGGVQAGSSNQTMVASLINDEPFVQSLPYHEGFNSCSTGLPGEWEYVSLGSNKDWYCSDDKRGVTEEAGDYALEANGFGGTEPSNDWAISPPIDLGNNATKMNFYTLKRFSDAVEGLSILISTDYTGNGNPTSATWTDLTSTLILDSNTGDFIYEYSGDVDLSSYSGLVNIAFQYETTGTGAGNSTQWRVDELNVLEGSPASLTVTESLSAFDATDNGGSSASQSYTVEGTNLTDDVTVTASNYYELSLNNTDFSSEITLTATELNAGAVTVNVRFSPSSGYNNSIYGTIKHSTSELIGGEINVTGSEAGNVRGVQINEIHYDNDAGDVGEFLEVVVTGTDIVTGDLPDYRLVFYNGSDGNYYTDTDLTVSSRTLNVFTRTEDQGNFYYVLEGFSIQNGDPDGIALVGPTGELIQFLSYDGTFTANEGAANGIQSNDIGVGEPGTAPIGSSVQRKSDGTWEYTPGTNTKGAKNANE